jgi:glucose-6-phosphate dehydrogenase assembly protein OpcA
MAGIYQRDNLAQLYAGNLEKALARRDAYEKERAERVKSNVDAINKGIASVGRAVTYGTSGTAAEKLAALQKEYEEALAEEARVKNIEDIYNQQVEQRKAFDSWANASPAQRHGWGYAQAMDAVPQLDLVSAYYRRGI